MKIRVLGRFTVADQGTDVTPTGMAAQLLKAVVCMPRALHWEELAELLWPETPPRRGRTRLRNVVSRLRASSGEVVQRREGLISLSERATVDSREFEAVARRAMSAARGDEPDAIRLAQQAWALYRGELLPEDRYVQWTLEPRERLRRQSAAVLELLVGHARAEGHLDVALQLLESAIPLQPDAEEVALQAVELLLALGRRTAALRLLLQTADRLELLGLRPSEKWDALAAEVRHSARPGA